MMIVDADACTGCGVCAAECPTKAIRIKNGLAAIGDGCVGCCLCARVCDEAAVQASEDADAVDRIRCDRCPVQCTIADGFAGACRRYVNHGGRLQSDRPLLLPSQRGPRTDLVLEPLITGVGAGTTSPCYSPAPYCVEETLDGVDVVTVVSEVPLSYSNLKLKVDTNVPLGAEGAAIRRQRRPIGHMETEEYGSKMLAVGGVNTFHGKYGSTAARTIADICARKRVTLRVEDGARIEVRLGEAPVIDGKVAQKMRVGCGSACMGMFAPYFRDAADEVIVLDPQITGLLTEHLAGRALGLSWSGVTPVGVKSTIGRYFGTEGPGLGGTSVAAALDAIASIDMRIAQPGMTILVTDTAGENATMLRLGADGALTEVELTEAARRAVAILNASAQPSRVSAVLMVGVGGSARAGVSKYPIKLNEAVHAGEVRLTVGGAPVYLLPGGGITAAVDVEAIPNGAIGWVPTPCVVAPIEYTMTREIYARIEGHLEAVRSWSEVEGSLVPGLKTAVVPRGHDSAAAATDES